MEREFTQKDYEDINEAYESLMALAIPRCQRESEVEMIRRAFEFANQAHKNVRRRSGDPYILHPIEVAKIVVGDIGLGYKSIAAALLHDVVEDTSYTVDDIRNLFSEKIAQLVDGLTKIKTVLDNEDRTKISTQHTESLQAENFKRILLTMGDDARVVLIKMADRLHNCRTIQFMPEHKRDKILSETMFIFIPLAHRLGLYSIKSEMENIWLKYKQPEEFDEITRMTNVNIGQRDRQIDEFIEPIDAALKAKGYKFKILKRVKTPYSIWHKMRTKHVPFEQIYDLYAVRIIFEPTIENNVEAERTDAYAIRAILGSLYNEQPGRTRDWVMQPKSNGYEALHCTLMSHAGIWVEVQIRSHRMDDIAEKGIAAHWAYKKDGYASENDSQMDQWLAKVKIILSSDDITALELLDIIHNDLIANDIVVFTPKGEQKTIQSGATALDFAYLIHSHIGEKAIAAKVNMKLVPLSQPLRSGDQVEIITTSSGHPKVEWLQFLQTRTARSRVIEYFRGQFDEIEKEGERIYDERIKVMGLHSTNDVTRRFLEYSQLPNRREFYFRVGLGIIGPEEFRRIVNEDDVSQSSLEKHIRAVNDVNGELNYVMSECCHAIPGDPVIGFKLDNGNVMVHLKSCHLCQSLASKFGNRMVELQWLVMDDEYPIRISIKGIDRVGLLNRITQCISLEMGINIRKLQLGCEGGIFEGFIELLVRDRKNVDKLISALKKVDGVQDVVRTDI